MKATAQAILQQRLFDPRAIGPDDDALVLFLAVPTGSEEHDLLIDSLRIPCQRAGWSRGRNLRFLTGEDAGSKDPRVVARWQRETFATQVDGLLGVHGASWGCGREFTLASELLIPWLLAVPETAPRSATRGPDGCGLAAEGGFRSAEDLDRLASEWLVAYLEDIIARHVRRVVPPSLSDELRKPILRAWNTLDEPERRRLSKGLGMVSRQVSEFLMSDRRFAEGHLEAVLSLAYDLQVWDPRRNTVVEPMPTAGQLDGREFAAFQDVRSLLHLTNADAAALLAAGTASKQRQGQLQAAGVDTRFSLRSRNGWLRVWRSLCNERST